MTYSCASRCRPSSSGAPNRSRTGPDNCAHPAAGPDQRRSRLISPGSLLDHRPAVVLTGNRCGDWGAAARSAISTLVDRATPMGIIRGWLFLGYPAQTTPGRPTICGRSSRNDGRRTAIWPGRPEDFFTGIRPSALEHAPSTAASAVVSTLFVQVRTPIRSPPAGALPLQLRERVVGK
jgi:hypothetical protein